MTPYLLIHNTVKKEMMTGGTLWLANGFTTMGHNSGSDRAGGFNTVNSVFFPLMEIILCLNYVLNAWILKLTGSYRGSYIVFICMLLANLIIVSRINVRKFNRDYQKEDSLKTEQ